MAKKSFNIGDYLKTDNVSKSDTEQIVRIDLERIDPDPANFYSLDGIDELAGNIELIGLQQPLRVRPDGDRFVVISGHRRRAACLLIRDGGSEQFAQGVPCIVEYGEATPAMRELRLIYANSSTRVMSAAEISKQAERVTELLYQLKEQGVEFPGRMREHVAQACQVSESKLARLHAIRNNLIDVYRLSFDAGELTENNAYLLSRESETTQHGVFTRIGPTASGLTANELEAVIAAARNRKCDTSSAAGAAPSPQGEGLTRSTFDAEAYLAERADEDRAFFEMLSEEADRFLKELGAGSSRQDGILMLKECLGRYHHSWLYDRVDVQCSPKGVRLWDINGPTDYDITRTWTDVYDMLCTIALNRAAADIGAEPEDEEDESPTGCAGAPFRQGGQTPEWQTGDPPRIGRYFCKVDMGDSKLHENRCWWGDDGWSCYGSNLKANGWKVVGWWPLPKEG